MTTLQEQFEKDYPNKEVREIDISKKYKHTTFTNRDLDLREYKNLTFLNCSSSKITSLSNLPNSLTTLDCYNNNLTFLDASNCPNLTNLFIDAYLFHPENKIIGLEKSSIVRLDCRGGNLLMKSNDPQFI